MAFDPKDWWKHEDRGLNMSLGGRIFWIIYFLLVAACAFRFGPQLAGMLFHDVKAATVAEAKP